MFNKSTLFNRNDPVPRRETVPTVGAGSKSTATGADNQASRAVNVAREPLPTASPETLPATPAAPPAMEAGAPARTDAASDSGMGARLIVGPEVKLKGAEILDCDTLVVEGRVEATMDSRVVRIAEHGSFVGKVSIDIAEIHGSFEGELTARAQLVIHSTGRVKGTIRYGKLVADEGCELCGDVSVISAASPVKARVGAEKSVSLDAAA